MSNMKNWDSGEWAMFVSFSLMAIMASIFVLKVSNVREKNLMQQYDSCHFVTLEDINGNLVQVCTK